MANGNNRGGGSRPILIILILLVLAALVAYALGLFNIDQTKEAALPSVKVEAKGGQLPSFDVDTADIDVQTKNATIEVPKVEVETTKTKVEVPTVTVPPARSRR